MCGAIDGSHIPILAPQEYHTEYFNRKGWYSIVLQAVVDGKGLFWNVFAGYPAVCMMPGFCVCLLYGSWLKEES